LTTSSTIKSIYFHSGLSYVNDLV